jgi:uncharacterized protein with von Willebrand factor type A (vWA) domain
MLLHNLLLFGRLLRRLGLDVNPGRMIDLVQALQYVEIGHRPDFYHACRSLLVHDRADVVLFDQAFELFWRRPAGHWLEVEWAGRGRGAPRPRPVIGPPAPDRPAQRRPPDPDEPAATEIPVIEITATYSARELLRRKEFSELTGDEIDAIQRMMGEIIWELGQRRSRRQRPGPGRAIDMRRSLRRSLRLGGELIELKYRRRQLKPRPLVIIADTSGSMERYTRLLLHFIYGLSRSLEQPVEAFVFSTRLTCISRPLRDRDVERAMREVSRSVPDWSGGTRIGDALKRFNQDWARRVLGRGAVVLLISDGWDRGDPVLLQKEIGRLQRSCHRLIWLNPLLGSPDYRPLTRGMQAALPYIDDFMPVHNLASLEELAQHLSLLSERRPARGPVQTMIPGRAGRA